MPQKQPYKLAESVILILDHSAKKEHTQKKKQLMCNFSWLATIWCKICGYCHL